MTPSTRRDFLLQAGFGLAGAALTRAASDPVELPNIKGPADQQSGPAPEPLPPSERVGFAVVGLGHLAINQILPAFAKSKKAKVTALVSGTPPKVAEIARQYGISAENVYDYKTYDRLADNPAVQVIYIVLPNGMHAEYTIRGAAAGKHILCEKPMANTVAEAEQMVAACHKADRKLMIAYRIQYEPLNRLMKQMVRDQRYGALKFLEAVNGQQQGDPNQWRQKKALAGGGSLFDVGLYCLNTLRYLLGREPVEVSASLYSTPNDPRFREVEETVAFQMRFPNGVLANCATSYGFHEARRYRVYAENAWFGMDPAFSYGGLQAESSHAEGLAELRARIALEAKDQFALELDHMADCVLKNRQPFTPGEEGLQDQRIMEAIYRAAAEDKPQKLAVIDKIDAFRGDPPS